MTKGQSSKRTTGTGPCRWNRAGEKCKVNVTVRAASMSELAANFAGKKFLIFCDRSLTHNARRGFRFG